MLTPTERVFADAYVKTMKVGQAATAAGVTAVTGSRMLRRPLVCAAIAEAMDEKSRLARIDASWVLRRAALLADFNIKNFIVVDDSPGGGGRLYYDFTRASDDDWYCINEITVGAVRARVRQGTDRLYVDEVKIKTIDKLRALEMVGKHVDVQAFKDRADVAGVVVVTDVKRVIVAAAPQPVAVLDAPARL